MRPLRRRASPVVAGLIACIVAGTAAAAPEQTGAVPKAKALLTAASKAVRRLSYTGVLVYTNGGNLDTLRLFHRLVDGVEQERLVSLTGAPREIIRKDGKLTSILPEKQLVLISQQPAKGLLNRVKQFSAARMQKAYRFTIGDDRRVAGRLGRTVAITPRDDYRYGYRMLIDQKTRLPLKLELRSDDHVLEKMLFSQVSFPESIPNDRFEPSYDVSGFRVVKHQAIEVEGARSAPSPWHASKLPAGFELAESGIREVSENAKVRQMLFSDGLATVSAFIAPVGLRTPLQGSSSRGAVNAYGRSVGDRQITVVGQVPAATVKLIAEHLTRRGSD